MCAGKELMNMQVYLLVKRNKILFGHYAIHEIEYLERKGWTVVHGVRLQPISSGKQRRKRKPIRQIVVNKNGVPIYA